MHILIKYLANPSAMLFRPDLPLHRPQRRRNVLLPRRSHLITESHQSISVVTARLLHHGVAQFFAVLGLVGLLDLSKVVAIPVGANNAV